MRIGYTTPPTAAPFNVRDLVAGIGGLLAPGRATRRFEISLCRYFDSRFVFLVSSGKAALTVILRALARLQPHRKNVLIPAYTCYSVPASVAAAGLKVQLADLGQESLDFDPNDLDSLLTDPQHHPNNSSNESHPGSSEAYGRVNPLAIIPTHLFGVAAESTYFETLREKTGAFIVEDAAQSMGGESGRHKLGTAGDVSFFSLGRGKALTTLEGGVILTNNSDIARQIHHQLWQLEGYPIGDQLKMLAVCLSLMLMLRPQFFWIPKSLPFLRLGETIYEEDFNLKRMSGFQAGLARYWQSKLAYFRRVRRKNAIFWQEHLVDSRLRHLLAGDTAIPDLLRYPILVENPSFRQRILEVSEELGLGIMPGYPDTINHIQEICHLFQGEQYAHAERMAGMLITLPIHPLLSHKGKERILWAMKGLLNQ